MKARPKIAQVRRNRFDNLRNRFEVIEARLLLTNVEGGPILSHPRRFQILRFLCIDPPQRQEQRDMQLGGEHPSQERAEPGMRHGRY